VWGARKIFSFFGFVPRFRQRGESEDVLGFLLTIVNWVAFVRARGPRGSKTAVVGAGFDLETDAVGAGVYADLPVLRLSTSFADRLLPLA